MARLARLVGNRFIVVFGGVALAALAWNIRVALDDDGIVAGRVVGPGGEPAAGAKVILKERTFTTVVPKASATADAEGRFRFTGQPYHHFALSAEHDSLGAAPERLHRRYFQYQNVTLAEPLRLGPAK